MPYSDLCQNNGGPLLNNYSDLGMQTQVYLVWVRIMNTGFCCT